MSRTTLIALVLSLAGLAAIAGATPAAAAPLAQTAQAVPQANGPSRTPLTRIYRGADGGALYLRQLGTEVYGFGEHPGLKYAYVLKGSISGDRINGSWWDVPKGARAETGSLRLRWTQGGARIVRSAGDDLGPDVFTAIPPDGIPWPNRQAAGFQATSTGDLDGVFVGDDRSRHYVRETSANTVWVAERPSQPGERPGWVSVFTGKRKAGGGFAGT
ncbi:MAG TPA: hypothetical protein VK874_09375, partial [Gaiellaceae bacterium]|nr:hypothetical protein [Gaiellaceae bacterium]